MKKLVLVTLAGLALSAALPVGAAGDAAAGKTRSAVCAGCHGADGNSVNPDWPKLASQHPQYIAKQLANFKAGDRKNPTMSPQAAGLSEEDMANLAAYFSSQAIKGGKADEEKVALGEAVYRGGNKSTGVAACIGCHAPNGKGNPEAKFPSLAGQHAKYIATQLRHFRAGTRSNDAGKMMRNVAIHMTDAEIDAVAQYVQGLK